MIFIFYNQLTTDIPHITVNRYTKYFTMSDQLHHFEVLLITFRSVTNNFSKCYYCTKVVDWHSRDIHTLDDFRDGSHANITIR